MTGWEDGSGFEAIYAKLEELVGLMANFFRKKPQLQAKFVARIDLKLIKQMIANKAFDLGEFTKTLDTLQAMLYEIESPYQAARTREFVASFKDKLGAKQAEIGAGTAAEKTEQEISKWYATMIVDALQELFRKVDVCQQELDNFLLSILPP